MSKNILTKGDKNRAVHQICNLTQEHMNAIVSLCLKQKKGGQIHWLSVISNAFPISHSEVKTTNCGKIGLPNSC